MFWKSVVKKCPEKVFWQSVLANYCEKKTASLPRHFFSHLVPPLSFLSLVNMATKVKAFLTLVCHICGKSGFIQKRNLREHYKHHDWLLSVGTKRRSQAFDCYDLVSTEEAATITVYQCPSCFLYFKTLEQVGNHIKQCHLQSSKVEPER